MKVQAELKEYQSRSDERDILAQADITLGEEVTFREIKVAPKSADAPAEINLLMPTVVNYNGYARQVYFPITADARLRLENAVAAALAGKKPDRQDDEEIKYKVTVYTTSPEAIHGKVYINNEYVIGSVVLKRKDEKFSLELPKIRTGSGEQKPLVTMSSVAQAKLIKAVLDAEKRYGEIKRYLCNSLSDLGKENQIRFFKPLARELGDEVAKVLEKYRVPYSVKITDDEAQFAIKCDNALDYSKALRQAKSTLREREKKADTEDAEK